MSGILGCWIAAISCRRLVDGLYQMCIYPTITDVLHHGKVLEIVMGLKQGIPREEFD